MRSILLRGLVRKRRTAFTLLGSGLASRLRFQHPSRSGHIDPIFKAREGPVLQIFLHLTLLAVPAIAGSGAYRRGNVKPMRCYRVRPRQGFLKSLSHPWRLSARKQAWSTYVRSPTKAGVISRSVPAPAEGSGLTETKNGRKSSIGISASMATCALFGRNLLNELIAYIILPGREREGGKKIQKQEGKAEAFLSYPRNGGKCTMEEVGRRYDSVQGCHN